MFKILSDYGLLKSLEYYCKNDISRSRLYLDKVLGIRDQDYEFIIAFDALVIGSEDRHEDSLERFRECRTVLENKSDPDSQYVKLFCQFYECLGAQGRSCEKYMDKALSLKTGKIVRKFLRFPPTWPPTELERREFRDLAKLTELR